MQLSLLTRHEEKGVRQDAVTQAGGALAAGCWYAAGKDCIQPNVRNVDESLPSKALLQKREVKVAFDGDFGIAYGEMLVIKNTIEAALKERP